MQVILDGRQYQFAFTSWHKINIHTAYSKTQTPPCVEVDHTYLKQPEPDQIAAWASRGAGLFTDEILQTVRDPTSLSAQR